MNRYIFVLMSIIACCQANAQKIEWAMTVPYSYPQEFRYGVMLPELYGNQLVGRQGNVVFSGAYTLSRLEDLIMIESKSGKKGLIDLKGRILIDPLYDNIQKCHDLFRVELKKKCGLVDSSGTAVLPVEYETIYPMGNLIKITTKRQAGLLDRQGAVIYPLGPKYFFEPGNDKYDFPILRVYPQQGNDFYISAVTGQRLDLPYEYENTIRRVPGTEYARLISRKNRSYYIDCEGNPVDSALLFCNSKGVSLFWESGKIGFRESSGKVLLAPRYDDYDRLDLWQNGYINVREMGKWGVVNDRGEEVVAPKYTNITSFGPGCSIADKTSDLQVLLNGKAEEVCSGVHVRIEDIDYGCAVVCYKAPDGVNHYGFLNLKTGRFIDTDYRSISSFANGYTLVIKDGKVGMIDTAGTCIVPCIYDNLTYFRDGLALGDLDGKQCFVNRQGEIVLSEQSGVVNILGPFREGIAPVTSNFKDNKGQKVNGYIYNIYTNTPEKIVARWGATGNGENLDSLNEKSNEVSQLVVFHYGMGMRNYEEQKYEAALHHFETVNKLVDGHKDSYFSRGLCYMQMGKYQNAIQHFNYAIYEHLKEPAIRYICRGVCYANLSNYKNAIADFKKALKADPDNEQAAELLNEAVSNQTEKWNNILNTLSMVTSTLGEMANGLAQMHSTTYGPTWNNASPSGRPSGAGVAGVTTGGRKQCSRCNGTGYDPSPTRPSMYNYSEEDYSSNFCEICGSHSNHYHKSCSSCLGKGYR